MKKPESNETVRDTAKSSAGGLKKVKYGSMSLVVIALMVALVVILNVMAAYLVKRQPLKIDLTADKRYELSSETIDYLKDTLDKDVEIIVTCPRDDFDNIASQVEFSYLYYYGIKIDDCPFDMIPVLLEKYEMYANQGKGSVKVRYVDLDKNPKAVAKYKEIYGEEIGAQSMIFACGDRVRVLDQGAVGGMIAPDLSDQTKLSLNQISLVFAGESAITSEIMNVTDAHPINVAFVTKINGGTIFAGSQRDADAVSGLRDQLLTKNGYFCTDIDLAADELDTEKYDMVVIPMPQVDFEPAVIQKLNDFLNNGGVFGKQMIFVADSATTNTPNIKEFLADWRIELKEGTILSDEIHNFSSDKFSIQVKSSGTEEVGTFTDSSLGIIAPYAQEVSIINKNNEAIPSAVLQTYESAYPYEIKDGYKNTSEAGVKNIAVVSRKEKQIGMQIDNFEIANSQILVLGSGYFTNTSYLVQSNLYNNTSALLSIINQMTGKESDNVVIPEKTLQHAVIAPTATEQKRIKIAVIFVIPLIVAGIGAFVLLRRKNR